MPVAACLILVVGFTTEATDATRVVLWLAMSANLYKWRLSGSLTRIGSVGEMEWVSVRRAVGRVSENVKEGKCIRRGSRRTWVVRVAAS